MKNPHERFLIAAMVAVLTSITCGVATAKSFESSLDPPHWAVKSLNAAGIEVWPGDLGGASYTVSRHLSPNYVEGDFDGDGKSDLAILIRRKADDKFGMAVLLRADTKTKAKASTGAEAMADGPHAGAKATILGAGSLGQGDSDFRRMDAWSVLSEESFPAKVRNAWNGPQPKSNREGLILNRRGAAEGLVFYDGSKFVWTPYGG